MTSGYGTTPAFDSGSCKALSTSSMPRNLYPPTASGATRLLPMAPILSATSAMRTWMDLSVNGCSLSYQAAIIPRLPGKSRTYLQTGFVGMPTQVIVVVVTGGLVVVVVVEVDVEVLVDVLVE